ncbi:SRPBCC family protein [Pontibacter populi]|uniref:SRPBCC family protein n=1 Tax=Pontibacter populi TaxID=890055 RepID=A0ABV1RR88_9BACT
MEKNKITVQSTINADIQKVWTYWTSPEHIVNWNFASDDWHCPFAKNDVRTGGKFSSTMASKDGKMSFDFGGEYDEVVDQKKLAFTMADGRQVIVSFEDMGNNTTKVTEAFDAENTHSDEMQRAGWQAIVNNFKKYVEAA